MTSSVSTIRTITLYTLTENSLDWFRSLALSCSNLCHHRRNYRNRRKFHCDVDLQHVYISLNISSFDIIYLKKKNEDRKNKYLHISVCVVIIGWLEISLVCRRGVVSYVHLNDSSYI